MDVAIFVVVFFIDWRLVIAYFFPLVVIDSRQLMIDPRKRFPAL